MNKHRRRLLPWVFIVLGTVLSAVALFMLSQTPQVLQYCLLAPEAGENGNNIRDLATSAKTTAESMKEIFTWMTVDGRAEKVSISTGSNTLDVSLYAMGEGWLEVYPTFLKKGDRITETDLQKGAAVMMLDDGLAFRLFGEELPERASVKLNNVEFRVVGTVRHAGSLLGGRGVGDGLEYDVYVPLLSAAASGIALDTITLSAQSGGNTGAITLFEQSARQWSPAGQIVDLSKEAMRRTILPRVLLLIIGLFVLAVLFRMATVKVMEWFSGYRQALKMNYFHTLIPKLALTIGLSALVYGVLILAAWLLLSFSAQPLYVFTEWVPDNIVQWSSISKVFWNLVSQTAGLVRLGTRELRVIEFWGGALRWGMVLLLLGAVLLPGVRRPREDTRSVVE